MNTMALLLSDTYKQCHDRMYPEGLTKLTSYWVPRKSMLENQNEMVFFGLQAFIQEWLINYFDDYFFNLREDEVKQYYSHNMNIQIGEQNYDINKIIDLHKLGYLPLEIKALPEGTLVPMGMPCIEITNTHNNFAWLVQWIECILQVELWKPCAHATIGYMYHQIAQKWYDKTVVNGNPFMACADFGMRGMSCMQEAQRCSAAWLLSFNKTSTIPAIDYIEEYYLADCKNNNLGLGAVSTEHSVMGANYAIDGDEITFIRRLLNDLYPNTSFSMVSDTYDYWNLVNNLLPQVKDDIMKHNGKLLIRPDSGDIVDISVRTVERLWEMFGGTINEKGYKELDPHIGIIYGDGCTMSNIDTIWNELAEKGFAANCIYYGVGAFCFSAIIENQKLIAITRDTFGIAMKATYGIIDEKELFIFKDPKTDTQKLKKSHKGLCYIYKDNNKICYADKLYQEQYDNMVKENGDCILTTVFKDGKLGSKSTFNDIRRNLYNV